MGIQTMSTQWEVVGKSNKKLNVPTKKLTKTEKKQFVENAPKIEDILPLDQIRSLYDTRDKSKEVKKPQPSAPKEIEKKPKKKVVVSEKKDQAVKEKSIPKTLDAAAKQLDVKELIDVVNLNQVRFADAPVLWIKSLAEYLNVRLTFAGTVPLLRPQDSFLSLLSADSRDVLHKAIQKPSPAVMKHFFEHCLSAMATEMSRGNASVTGFKIVLQLVATHSAAGLLENPTKIHTLWSSFQNNPTIGLAILWALGQLGIKDVPVGLTVWQELMLPMMEMRNYSGFVVSYLKMMSSVLPKGKPLDTSQLMAVMDIAYSSSTNVPANLQKELQEGAAILLKKTLECKPDNRLRLLFQPLLQRLNPSSGKPLERELVSSLLHCLRFDAKCFSIWNKLYRKHTYASARLLQYLRNGHWKDLNVKLLRESLLTFQTANIELLPNQQFGDSVKECQSVVEDLLPKLRIMTVTRKSFPWRFGSFLLMLAIGGLLAFDIQRHGSFESSSTGRFLRDVGALKYSKQAWEQTKLYSSKGATWAKENVPVYYQIVSEKSGPYLHQAKEATLVAGSYLNQTYFNIVTYAQEKAPLVEAWCDQYAPGLMHKVQTHVAGAWGMAKECTLWLVDVGQTQLLLVFDWAKTNVFVGSLSPEKIQQFSKEAINTTQEYAFWTYQWVIEKYHTLASVPKV